MKGTVTVIDRAAITVRIEFDNTARVLTDRDTNECGITLSVTGAKAVAITVLDLAGFRMASEIRQALELAWGTPAVTLDGELAAVVGVVTRGVVIGEALVIDGFASVVDDSKAGVMSVRVSTGRTGDCGKATRRPDDFEVLGVDATRGSHQAEKSGAERKHDDAVKIDISKNDLFIAGMGAMFVVDAPLLMLLFRGLLYLLGATLRAGAKSTALLCLL